jgi:hypothetical protein
MDHSENKRAKRPALRRIVRRLADPRAIWGRLSRSREQTMDELGTADNSALRIPFEGLAEGKDQVGRDQFFVVTLVCTSLAIHVFMALSLGAKFWYDTIAYFQLAEDLTSPAALRSLYSGPFGIIYQHVMPGLSFLILVFDGLFASHMWLAFAIFQNAIDIFASVYLATSLSGYFGKRAQFAVTVLIALFPYFSAFHNAILTESLTSSLVMIIVGVTIRCLENRISLVCGVAIILFLGILGAQLRIYVAGISGGLSLLVLVRSPYRRRIGLYLATAASVILGVLAFPLYRAAIGAGFFVPNADALMLVHTHYVNWDLDDRSKRAVDGAISDQGIVHKLEVADGEIGTSDVIKMVDDLVRTGINRTEAIKKIAGAAWVVRTQSPAVVARQFRLSLSSLGFQWLTTCCEPSRILAFENFTGEKLLAHLKYYYRWNSGLDQSDYSILFQNFSDGYRQSPCYDSTAIDWYTVRVGPFVLARPSPWRDFLQLSMIPPDLIILTGLAGFLVIAQTGRRIIIIIPFFIMIVVYAASLSTPIFGDNRYAHFLWPFYLVGCVGLLARAIRGPIRRIQLECRTFTTRPESPQAPTSS